jgi:hypothetical protein
MQTAKCTRNCISLTFEVKIQMLARLIQTVVTPRFACCVGGAVMNNVKRQIVRVETIDPCKGEKLVIEQIVLSE